MNWGGLEIRRCKPPDPPACPIFSKGNMSADAATTGDKSLEVAELDIERLPLSEHLPEQIKRNNKNTTLEIQRKRRDNAILFGHINGKDAGQLAREAGIAKSYIYQILRSQGVNWKKNIEQRNMQIIHLFNQGLSKGEIIAETGNTEGVVKHVLRNNDMHYWIPESVKCDRCGASFLQKASKQRFCSYECYLANQCEAVKARRLIEKGRYQKCEHCGRLFEVKGADKYRRRFCGRGCATSSRYTKHELRNKEIFYYRHTQMLTYKRIGEIFDLDKSGVRKIYFRELLKHNLRIAGLGASGAEV